MRAAESTGTLIAAAALATGVLAAAVVGLHFGRGGGPNLIAAGVVLLAGGALAFRFPLLGLIGFATIIALNLSDNLIVHWGLPSVNRIVAPGLIGILLLRFLFQGEKPFFDAAAVSWLSAYLLLVILSSLYARNRAVAIDEFFDQLRFVIIAALVLAFLGMRGGYMAFTGTLVATTAFACLLAVHKFTIGDPNDVYGGLVKSNPGSPRLAGPFSDANVYASILVFIMPFALDRALWGQRRWVRLYGAAAAALILFAILMTESRGGLVALAVGCAVYALTLDRKTALRVAVAGAAAACVAVLALSDQLLARFASIFAATDLSAPPDRAVAGRLGSWTVAIELFWRYPLLGVGGGNFNALFQDTANDLGIIFRGQNRSPHSIYLEYLSEYGIVGLTLMLAIFARAGIGVAVAMARMRALGETRLWALCGAHGAALAGYLTAEAFLQGSPFLLLGVAIGIALPRIMEATIRHRDEAAAAA